MTEQNMNDLLIPTGPVPTRILFSPVTLSNGEKAVRMILSHVMGITEIFLQADEELLEGLCEQIKEAGRSARTDIVLPQGNVNVRDLLQP